MTGPGRLSLNQRSNVWSAGSSPTLDATVPAVRSTLTVPPAFNASLDTPRRLESERTRTLLASARRAVEGAHERDRIGHSRVWRISIRADRNQHEPGQHDGADGRGPPRSHVQTGRGLIVGWSGRGVESDIPLAIGPSATSHQGNERRSAAVGWTARQEIVTRRGNRQSPNQVGLRATGGELRMQKPLECVAQRSSPRDIQPRCSCSSAARSPGFSVPRSRSQCPVQLPYRPSVSPSTPTPLPMDSPTIASAVFLPIRGVFSGFAPSTD